MQCLWQIEQNSETAWPDSHIAKRQPCSMCVHETLKSSVDASVVCSKQMPRSKDYSPHSMVWERIRILVCANGVLRHLQGLLAWLETDSQCTCRVYHLADNAAQLCGEESLAVFGVSYATSEQQTRNNLAHFWKPSTLVRSFHLEFFRSLRAVVLLLSLSFTMREHSALGWSTE